MTVGGIAANRPAHVGFEVVFKDKSTAAGANGGKETRRRVVWPGRRIALAIFNTDVIVDDYSAGSRRENGVVCIGAYLNHRECFIARSGIHMQHACSVSQILPVILNEDAEYSTAAGVD